MAEQQIKRAMVLAAGLGQRMRPLTDTLPKPLVPFAGKPLVDHVLTRLWNAGITQAVVNVHYRADQLSRHLRVQQAGCDIIISDERDLLLDTGGGIIKALPHFGSEPFITHNSDSVWQDADGHCALPHFMSAWRDEDMEFLMLLANPNRTLGYSGAGDFVYSDEAGRLRRRQQGDTDAMVFTGVSITHPRAFESAPAGKFSMNVLWDDAIARGRVFGQTLDGTWMHIGTPDALRAAETWMRTRGAQAR